MDWKPTKGLLLKAFSPLILSAPSLALACYPASPANLSLESGASGSFAVQCDSYCTASVSASSQDTGVATVTPASQTIGASPKSFSVLAESEGSTTISVAWSCSAYGSGNSTVSVSVEPPPTLATGTDGNGNKPHSGYHGDPVSTYSGELYQQFEPDLQLGGPMNLSFSRYYGGMLDSDGVSGSRMGTNWRHNFLWQLSRVGANDVQVLNDKGALVSFVSQSGAWEQATASANIYKLAEDSGTGDFTLFDPRASRFYVFSSSGQLKEINDGRGNNLTLSRNFNGSIKSITDGLGRTLTLTYHFSGNLLRVSDGSRTVQFEHSGDNLVSVTSVAGDETTFTYDVGGLMTVATKPLGNKPITQVFDDSGRVSTQADADNYTTSFTYGADLVTTITDPVGQVTQHRHSGSGELTATVDPNGDEVVMAYDGNGQRTGITNRLGDSTSIEYHSPSGRITAITYADGASVSYTYTERNENGIAIYDQTGVIMEDGGSILRSFDASGNLTGVTDQLGSATFYSYNANGQWESLANPLGGVTNSTYNSDATLATVSDPAGNTTSFSYDTLKRPIQTTFADGSTRRFSFDTADRLLTLIDENGGTTSFTYDANGNLASISDPLGGTGFYSYDGNDRLISASDPLGGVVNTTYDELGRVATYTDEAAQVTSYEYDANGNLVSVTDPGGNTWRGGFDKEGSKTSHTDPLGNSMNFVYDEMGRPVQVRSSLGHVSSMTYDSAGRLISVNDPLGVQKQMSRDAAGQLQGVTSGLSSVTYVRNALGQLIDATDPEGGVWSRDYDDGGRLVSSTDPLGNRSTASYDDRGRVSGLTFPGSAGDVAINYDAAGNITSRIYSDGTELNYTYDANGRITQGDGFSFSFDANGRMISSNGLDVTYDARGRITSVRLAAGKSVSYAYDANDRVTGVTDWAGATTSFSYDAAGRLTEMVRPNGINRALSYDNDSRLTDVVEGAVASISLTLDARGQTTVAERTMPEAATAEGVVDVSNTFDSAAQIVDATYDALGRATTLGSASYSWNLANRLTAVTRGGSTINYSYDGIGQKLSRVGDSITRSYVWSNAMTVPSILIEGEDGVDLRYYIRTPTGALLYSINAVDDSRNFYHFDEIGNTLFVSNDAGEVVASYAHSPFGVLLSMTGEVDNPFTWQGEYGAIDEGDGLFYMRARHYDANTGRFLSRDPVERVQLRSINPYQYAFNNPLMYRDVSGRTPTGQGDAPQVPTSELGGLAANALGTGLKTTAGQLTAGGASVFGNTASLINHLSEDEIDNGKVAEDVALLAVDGGSIYLTATAATAEAGALTGASIAGPAILVYAGARAGISIYEMYLDLEDLQNQIETQRKYFEILKKRWAREQAELIARGEEQVRQIELESEQREQRLRDEMRSQEEAELEQKQQSRNMAKQLGEILGS